MKATERLYLTTDRSRVVREGDPAAAFLYVTPGKEITAADAKKYGIKDLVAEPEAEATPAVEPEPEETVEATAEVKAEDEPAETRAVSTPPENKAQNEPRTRASKR